LGNSPIFRFAFFSGFPQPDVDFKGKYPAIITHSSKGNCVTMGAYGLFMNYRFEFCLVVLMV